MNPYQEPTGDRPTAPAPPRVTVSRPADFLGLVPYLLGFVPHESLVLLLIRDRQVALTARIDLPPLGQADAVVEQFVQLSGQAGATGMLLFAYAVEPEPARTLLQTLADELGRYGLVDALLVGPERWWSLMCSAGCCPSTGTVYDLASHPLAAEAVYAGLTAASGRDGIEAQVSGPPAADFELVQTLTRQVHSEVAALSRSDRQELVAALVRGFLAEPRRLDDLTCARLAVLVADITVRDVAWALMSRAEAEQHGDLWGQVVARAVAPWEAAPLCLLGMAAWISGNGALQNCCADRAHRVDPHYSMATLLDDISQQALPPSCWELLAPDLRAEVGPLVG